MLSSFGFALPIRGSVLEKCIFKPVHVFITAELDIQLPGKTYELPQHLKSCFDFIGCQMKDPGNDQIAFDINLKVTPGQDPRQELSPPGPASNIRDATQETEVDVIMNRVSLHAGVNEIEVVAQPQMQVKVTVTDDGQVNARPGFQAWG